MSLIVCSNEPEEDIVGHESSIFKPYSFRNALSSTMKIPKNAQIALHSAKINLDGSIVVGDESKVFYFYFGQGIKGDYTNANLRLDSQEDGVNLPIRISMFSDSTGVKRLNAMELASEATQALNRHVYHPQLVNNVEVTYQQDAATGAFTGYKFLLGAGLTSNSGNPNYTLNNLVPPTESAQEAWLWRRRYGNLPPHWSYTNSNDTGRGEGRFRVDQARRNTQAAIYNVPPIANKRGIYRVDISDMYVEAGTAAQACRGVMGLTRSYVSDPDGNQRYIAPPYYIRDNGSKFLTWFRPYCDFFMYISNTADRGYAVGDLVVGQCVVDTGDLVAGQRNNEANNHLPKWEPIEYWNHSGSIQHGRGVLNIINDNLTDGTKAHALEMRVNGEVVEYYIKSKGAAGDGSNGTYYPILPYLSTESANHQLKPISQDCWNLYPLTAINNTQTTNKDRSLKIEEYTAAASNYDRNPGTTYGQGWLDPADASYGLYLYDGVDAGGWLYPDRAGGYYSWEAECLEQGREADILEVMGRKPIDKGNGAGGGSAVAQAYEYDNLTGVAPDQRYDYLLPIFILSESERYIPTTQSGQFKRLFGFETTPVVDFFDDVNVVDYQVASSSVPRLISSKSIFVRLDNFTQQSMNAFNKNTSKIIAHLPRFDGTNVTGPLYLEPKNMIYLDLNNTEEIPANSFDISLCYSDETYADSLTGATIVVLHVREKGVQVIEK